MCRRHRRHNDHRTCPANLLRVAAGSKQRAHVTQWREVGGLRSPQEAGAWEHSHAWECYALVSIACRGNQPSLPPSTATTAAYHPTLPACASSKLRHAGGSRAPGRSGDLEWRGRWRIAGRCCLLRCLVRQHAFAHQRRFAAWACPYSTPLAPGAHAVPACMPAGAVAAASATAAAPRGKHHAATIVSLFSAESRPAGARLLFQHAPYQSFDRPLPTALEASLFEEYEFYFNETQVGRPAWQAASRKQASLKAAHTNSQHAPQVAQEQPAVHAL